MPAIYAHYRFGKKVYRQMPDYLKKVIRSYPEEYMAGLQGPDFLFFFNPLVKNRCMELGHQIHAEDAAVFLERARKILQVTGLDSPEGVYIFGFICHFMLDSSCHGFVEQMVEETGISHMKQETEFDRYLMERDGKCALRYPAHRLVQESQELAETISMFYRGISTFSVRLSLERMRLIKRLLYCPYGWKRSLLFAALHLVFGKESEYAEFVMQTHADPACAPICRELEARSEQAISECKQAILEFAEAIAQKNPIPERFQRNFH